MGDMVAVPLKQADNIDYTTVLRNFISENYDDPPGKYDSALSELTKMKSQATAAENHPSGVGHLLRYYQQCLRLSEKFPMSDEAQIRVNFAWNDAFKGGKKDKCKDIQYEAACVMFNVGAVNSQIGAQTPLNDEGCKLAGAAFQSAAGAFAYVRDHSHSAFGSTLHSDMSTECLNVLVKIMLGQAQECFYRKAQLGNMKGATLARVAAQAADYYSEASAGMEAKAVKGLFPKPWIAMVNAKKNIMLATAYHRQGLASQESSSFGPAIAYLQKAEALAKTAIKDAKSAGITGLLAGLDNIGTEVKALTKDNDLIYHEMVPTDENLPPITRAGMVKELPPAVEGADDVLAMLVPISIRRSHARYMADVDKLLRNETEAINAAMSSGQKVLAELGMPAALDAIAAPKGVPDELVAKSRSTVERGGLTGLRERLDHVRGLSEQNMAILREAVRMLDDEEHEDSQLRSRFVADWARTPSDRLTKELRDEAQSMQGKLEAAKRADSLVRQKFEDSYNIIDSLCRTNELPNMLPAAGPSAMSDQAKGVVLQLRQLLSKYSDLKDELPKLRVELTKNKGEGDIVSKLVSASDSASDENQVLNQHLKDVFGATQAKIAATSQEMKQLLDDIRKRTMEFQSVYASNDVTRKRETVLNNLGVAYDKFEELHSNLKEGEKFYTDMMNRLLKFQTKCSDFTEARKAEAAQLQKHIQTRPAQPQQPPAGQPGYWQPGMPVQYGYSGAPPQQPAAGYAPNYPPSPYGNPAYPPQQGYPQNPYGR